MPYLELNTKLTFIKVQYQSMHIPLTKCPKINLQIKHSLGNACQHVSANPYINIYK